MKNRMTLLSISLLGVAACASISNPRSRVDGSSFSQPQVQYDAQAPLYVEPVATDGKLRNNGNYGPVKIGDASYSIDFLGEGQSGRAYRLKGQGALHGKVLKVQRLPLVNNQAFIEELQFNDWLGFNEITDYGTNSRVVSIETAKGKFNAIVKDFVDGLPLSSPNLTPDQFKIKLLAMMSDFGDAIGDGRYPGYPGDLGGENMVFDADGEIRVIDASFSGCEDNAVTCKRKFLQEFDATTAGCLAP